MTVLIMSSAVAIILLWVLMHGLGFTKTARLQSAEQAAQLFATELPNHTLGNITLSADGQAACVDVAGEIAVLIGLGNKWRVRTFKAGDVEDIQQNGNILRIKTGLFADPAILLPFEDTETAELWRKRFAPLTKP